MTIKLSGQGLSLFVLAGVPVQTFASFDSTPSVGNGRLFDTAGSTTIVRFDDSTPGQIIAIRATGGITIQHNSNIQLAGGIDFDMSSGDILMLGRFAATEVFAEVSRQQLSQAISSYERSASFGVSPGASTQEATLGRASFSGSVIGLNVHMEDARTAGSVTVIVKVAGAPTLTAIISGLSPEFITVSEPIGTHAVAQNQEITVEVVTDLLYDNGPSAVTGLVANVMITESASAGAFPDVALLSSPQTFSAGQAVAQSTLAAGTGIVVDGNVSNNFDLQLTTNSTIADPTNVVAGQTINIAVRQDGVGGRTLGFGPSYLFPGGTPTVSSGINEEDLISCYVRAESGGTATVMLCSIAQNHS